MVVNPNDPHVIHICMTLKTISPPFNEGQDVEITFKIPECGEFKGGGSLNAIIDARDARKWMLGDHYNIRIKRA
jgi:hypothetical protein